uniref:ORF1 n=1 Tax=uncultured densovirus TaxID=748192 RepID=A0A7L7YTL2_9VIRU|nr:ORF1 [uncultured densovirus]
MGLEYLYGQVPAEHYNWYWDSLQVEDFAKVHFRNRFKKFYNKFFNRNISPRQYQHELAEFRSNVNQEVVEFLRQPDFEPVEEEVNQIQEVGEDTPLLENAGDFILEIPEEVAAGTAAVESGPGFGAAVGGFVAGSAIALGTKVALSKEATSGHKKPTFSVGPEHNYLGPGNSVGTGSDPDPVDDSDRIAYNHDLDYLKAKTTQDIKDADSAAVAQFGKKALEGDWRSALGAVGLQTKQLVEKHTGQLYPGKQLCLLVLN